MSDLKPMARKSPALRVIFAVFVAFVLLEITEGITHQIILSIIVFINATKNANITLKAGLFLAIGFRSLIEGHRSTHIDNRSNSPLSSAYRLLIRQGHQVTHA